MIRCPQVDHLNQQIIGFCIDNKCQNERPYCQVCLPRHDQHLNKLISQELLSDWMKERILTIQNVQKNAQECEIALDNLINVYLPYFKINMLPFSDLEFLKLINQLMIYVKQRILKQTIEQIKLIINAILKKRKNQKNIKQIDNQQITNSIVDKQILEQPKYQFIQESNLNPLTFDLIKENSVKQRRVLCYCFQYRLVNPVSWM
ncbi:unnamed protein product [Paramecium sonneborni]|uniref:Uncharacterized protein n=1 Tax=Paramecium sonneborni TaxID=65129 RepID=A0A8S1RSP8_9CILI|nr:unnamed protein product [Paramecium sonneborni]